MKQNTVFRAVLVEHGYSTSQYEHDVITAAGGEFIDAQDQPLFDQWKPAPCMEWQLARMRRTRLT